MTSFALQKTYLCIGDYLTNPFVAKKKKTKTLYMNYICYLENVIKNSITYSMVFDVSKNWVYMFGVVF